jgi:hypothetical protein
MSPKRAALPTASATDPFQERKSSISCVRVRLLGGQFEFESEQPELRRLVDWAYANLPRHNLSASVPRFRIRLMLAPGVRTRMRHDAAQIETLSGAGFLCATTSASDFVALSPEQRTGLIVVSRDMLHFPYHTRYELIEFAVFTLAARVQKLVPLHAACIGRAGHGLLLIGESGAGKSFTSLQCLLHGLDFLSEDSVLVSPDSMLATGIANFLHIKHDALRLLPNSCAALIRRSPVIRRRSGVEKFEIDLRRPEFHLAPRPLKIVGIVFLSPEKARRSLVTPVRGAQLLARLQESQPYAAHQPGWATFRRRAGATPAFDLRRAAHPLETVAALQELLAVALDKKSR